MLQLMDSQKGTIVDMFNMFSGGALHRFSLFALNVVPYISASIVVQLMGQIYGPWKAMKNEGESRSPQAHPVLALRRGVPGGHPELRPSRCGAAGAGRGLRHRARASC